MPLTVTDVDAFTDPVQSPANTEDADQDSLLTTAQALANRTRNLKNRLDALPTASAPANVTKAAAAVGVATTLALADHKHDVTTATAASIGTANAEGSASSLSRSDHVHNHGAQTDGTHHAAVIAGSTSGFMTGADKTKLDGIATSAAAVTSTAPVDVTKAAAAVGVGTTAARHDHKHDVSTAAPTAIGTANAEGSASSLARSDHVHALGSADAKLTVASVQTTSFAAAWDTFYRVDTSGGAVTVTLPTAVGNGGKKIVIKKWETGVVNDITLDGNSSETIDGTATATISAATSATILGALTVVSDGANVAIVARVGS